MSTYKELYDRMLNECSEHCASCKNYGAARILEETDPTAYICGFNDWTDTISEGGITCDCGRDITDPDVCIDDEVQCAVCAGTAFECDDCGEVIETMFQVKMTL